MIIMKALFVAAGLAGAVGICCWNHSIGASPEENAGAGGCCASVVSSSEPPPASAKAGCCAAPVNLKALTAAAPPNDPPGCCQAPPATTDQPDPASSSDTIVLSVEGMTCSRCVDSVREALLAIPGVTEADVSLEAAQASVRVDTSGPPTVGAMIDAIARAGLPRHEFVARDITDPNVTMLDASIAPLVDHFNANAGKPRFIALLSSTCPYCVAGAEAIQKSILDAFPEEDFSVSLVWIDMFRGDGAESVTQIARRYRDPRIRQFYDVRRLAGKAVSKALLYEDAGPAWDIYLFFDAEARWDDVPPQPGRWTHQLSGDKRADPARFRTGDDLVRQLHADASAVLVATTTFGSLSIEGMTCAACANAVQTAIQSVPGVEDAIVSFDTKRAEISMKAGTSVQGIIEAVQEAGFRANETSSADG